MIKKLKVGWFSFTCCEDNTIIFTELLNKNYNDWLSKIDFVHARIFRRDHTKEILPMDIAFIEGAISSDQQETKLKKIREMAKVLVAIGSCAVLGSPSNQRNFFNRENLDEIKPVLDRFKYKEKVLKGADVVKVDESVPGCPMSEAAFLAVFNKHVNQDSQTQ